jgi:hypothetical protein
MTAPSEFATSTNRSDVIRRIVEWAADVSIIPLARRNQALCGLLRYINRRVPGLEIPYAEEVYRHLRSCFIRNGSGTRYDERIREEIITRFEAIDREVRIASSPTDGLFLAEAALSLDAAGDIVECGCFQGGSTAKLSILAEATERRLFIFDSFEGLPDADSYNRDDLHVRLPSSFMNPWTRGDWAGSLDLVTHNVERWGVRKVCTFIKGWFQDTLTERNLPEAIGMAFTDVDLPSSARQCLVGVWPRLAERGVYFSHDVGFVKVLKEITDNDLWRDVLRDPVPVVFGAGYGLGDTSRMLGFMVKGRDIAPEYVKGLMVDK